MISPPTFFSFHFPKTQQVTCESKSEHQIEHLHLAITDHFPPLISFSSYLLPGETSSCAPSPVQLQFHRDCEEKISREYMSINKHEKNIKKQIAGGNNPRPFRVAIRKCG